MIPRADSEDKRRHELKRVVENYAIRTRELSEAVATLGWQITAGRPFQETIRKIEELRFLCEKASRELAAMIEPPQLKARAAPGFESQTPGESSSTE